MDEMSQRRPIEIRRLHLEMHKLYLNAIQFFQENATGF